MENKYSKQSGDTPPGRGKSEKTPPIESFPSRPGRAFAAGLFSFIRYAVAILAEEIALDEYAEKYMRYAHTNLSRKRDAARNRAPDCYN
jgi:hypothetical protein